MFFPIRSLIYILSLLACHLQFVRSAPVQNGSDLLVKLNYGTFQGQYNEQYNITYFGKIPFAQPPVGNLRFQRARPPLSVGHGIYDTNQTFDMCAQRTVNGSEDCLYLGLYSRPWTKKEPLRPVVVVFYGGAFIQGSASFTIPPSYYPVLNVSDTNDFIVIYPNYRVNAFGFLPGKALKDSPEADLNVGLQDQDVALEWVREHISAFGGDPNRVSIQGQSAGGGSVIGQVIARGGHTNPKLFHNALPGSPFWPKEYRYDDPEAEAVYDRLVQLTGCGKAKDSLKCLKQVDTQTIRNASLIIDASHTYNTSSYTWAPVIDGEFIQTRLTEVTKVNPERVWGMYNSHEGENFVPPGFANATGAGGFNSSVASFNSWLAGFLPRFSSRLLQQVKELYPEEGETESLTYNDTMTRAGLIYRDTVLACPALWVAEAAKTGYLGEYTISPAKHGSDTSWVSVRRLSDS